MVSGYSHDNYLKKRIYQKLADNFISQSKIFLPLLSLGRIIENPTYEIAFGIMYIIIKAYRYITIENLMIKSIII